LICFAGNCYDSMVGCSIGSYVFGFCTSLTNIAVDPMNPAYSSLGGVLYNRDHTTLQR
jgi:hypothetical protein